MKEQESVADHLLEGFKAQVKTTYPKKLKNVIAMQDDPSLQYAMKSFGFGFQLGVAAEIDLTFDDEEDLKEHPQFGQFAGMKFNDGVGMIMPAEELSSDLPPVQDHDEEMVKKMKE